MRDSRYEFMAAGYPLTATTPSGRAVSALRCTGPSPRVQTTAPGLLHDQVTFSGADASTKVIARSAHIADPANDHRR